MLLHRFGNVLVVVVGFVDVFVVVLLRMGMMMMWVSY